MSRWVFCYAYIIQVDFKILLIELKENMTALGLKSVVQVAEYGVHRWRPVLDE